MEEKVRTFCQSLKSKDAETYGGIQITVLADTMQFRTGLQEFPMADVLQDMKIFDFHGKSLRFFCKVQIRTKPPENQEDVTHDFLAILAHNALLMLGIFGEDLRDESLSAHMFAKAVRDVRLLESRKDVQIFAVFCDPKTGEPLPMQSADEDAIVADCRWYFEIENRICKAMKDCIEKWPERFAVGNGFDMLASKECRFALKSRSEYVDDEEAKPEAS